MKKYRFKTETKELLADMHTPVSLYLKMRDLFPQSALLESSDHHGNEDSLSFIGVSPLASIKIVEGRVTTYYPDQSEVVGNISEEQTVQQSINSFLEAFVIEGAAPSHVGLFGYTAYDVVRYFESIPVKPALLSKEEEVPEVWYTLYRYTLVFNHFRNSLTLIELLGDEEQSDINNMMALIENRNYASYNFTKCGEERAAITEEEYMEMVKRGIAHCKRGDVFQIVLSRRFMQPFKGDDFKVYRALRSINPSPYLFYFDFGSFRLFGSSPETHCKIEERKVFIDPIAGTAFRSGDHAVDRERTEALINDPKENAEHVMLVDLARNDLSRNAGEVKVEFYKEIQQFSHVIHLVSRVSGVMQETSDTITTYVDTFPAGTLSGAPKVRAMQLIAEIEQHGRGLYGGSVGFIGFDGSLNQAIIIRSFVSRDHTLYYQAGAGIVSKSDEARELQEVNNKLGALKRSIEMAISIKN